MEKIQDIKHLQEISDCPLKVGSKIYVFGGVCCPATYFVIDLMKDSDGESIPLRFNPRFDENAVLLKTKTCSIIGWQDEEIKGEIPMLTPGIRFELEIIFEENYFKFTVNGEHMVGYDYTYRVPIQQVKFIRISGDVAIARVKIY